MEFFSVKHREKIEVPDKDIKKRVIQKDGKDGKSSTVRYAAVATVQHKGSEVKLTKFIKKEDFDNLKVDVVK